MRNLWVAGRALTSACTYLAHKKPALDGSPPPPAGGCGPGPGPAPRGRWPSPPSLAEVTEFRALDHAPAPHSPAASPGPAAPPGCPQQGAGPDREPQRAAALRAGRGPPERHPGPPQHRPQRRTMRGRPATHLSRGRAGCPPGPRLPGALWDRDSGMPATGMGTGRVGSREHGERPDSSGSGERLGHVAVQPLIAARRFPPLRGPSPAPAPPGRRADAPSSHAQPRPPPARPSVRPLARWPGPAPPLTAAPAPRARRPAREARKVRRKVRVSGRACRGRSAAPPGTWRAKGGKEGARVLVGDFPPAISTPQFGSSPGKRIVSQAQTQATFPSNQ